MVHEEVGAAQRGTLLAQLRVEGFRRKSSGKRSAARGCGAGVQAVHESAMRGARWCALLVRLGSAAGLLMILTRTYTYTCVRACVPTRTTLRVVRAYVPAYGGVSRPSYVGAYLQAGAT